MRLLTILPSTQRGGIEEYTLTVTSAAVQAGWDVHVAFPKTEGTATLIRDFTDRGVHYHCLKINEVVREPSLLAAAKHSLRFARTFSLLLKLNPDIVQINLPNARLCLGSILACGLLKFPTIVRFGLVPSKFLFSKQKLNLYDWARSRNQQWLTISDNNRELVSKSFQIPYKQILRIYNGANISPEIAAGDRDNRPSCHQQICAELDIPETSYLALTVGRLEPQKGYKDLIPAIPHIATEFPEVRFVWVGDGNQRGQLVKKIQDYGVEDKVLFLGYRSDVPRLLQAANLFVFPTHYEGGQSFAIAEAMTYGLPIVTSDASGIPEVIEDQVHGLIFRTGDSCDLLETLRWATRHPDQMQEMAHKAQLRAQDFTEEKMLKQTLELLQRHSHGT